MEWSGSGFFCVFLNLHRHSDYSLLWQHQIAAVAPQLASPQTTTEACPPTSPSAPLGVPQKPPDDVQPWQSVQYESQL